MKSKVFTYSLLIVFLSLFASILPAASANAQEAFVHITFTVNTTNDTHDAHPGDGVCADQNGKCSLRAAIEEADALRGGSVIMVPAGTYGLILGTLYLTNNTIKIKGADRKTTIIKGNKMFRIMSIALNVFLQLSQLTLEGGNAHGGNGGGIENSGTLILSNSKISGNSAVYGGGIASYGTLTLSNSIISGNSDADDGGGLSIGHGRVSISNSIISGNSAGFGGGGLFISHGRVSISNSTISGNSGAYNGIGGGIESYGELTMSNSTISGNSTGSGGGIFNGDTLTENNSTISGNSATMQGGGLFNATYGTLTVSSSTISDNSAAQGGGLFNYGGGVNVSNSTISSNLATQGGGFYIDNGGTAIVSNSTISGNSGTSQGGNIYNNVQPSALTVTGTVVANSKGSANCHGAITDMGYNLDSDGSCGFTLSSDLNKVDPLLGPLQNNGGPTQTMALLQGSKAIDWMNNVADCPATDQRGYVRPDNGESACDIGAYESAY